MKRVYTEVRVVDTLIGFGITLDDRPVKTPGRRLLAVPARALAEAIAGEWRAQGAAVHPHTMPLMQLAAKVLDGISPNRSAVEAAILRFAETDMVCYRADAPAELVRRQRSAWEPLLDWLRESQGVRLAVTAGVLPVAQQPDSIAALAQRLRTMEHWRLGALQAAAAASGSFVIALALTEGQIDADQAFAAAELDESFEIDHWGEDAEAAKRRTGIAADLGAARRFRDLVGG